MFFLSLFMDDIITLTLILGIFIIIILFILSIFCTIYMNEIYETVYQVFNTHNNRTIPRRRQRRNAIYVVPQPIREIELTPLPKKNFIIIQNPNSPYTLGIEHSTE